MPTYEYACRSCGEHLEVVQSFKDEPLTDCPACGGPLRKVFGAIGIAFKGSGFYKTDSRAASSSKSKAGSGDKTPDTKSDTPGSSDTKSGTDAKKSDSSSGTAASKTETKTTPKSDPKAAASS